MKVRAGERQRCPIRVMDPRSSLGSGGDEFTILLTKINESENAVIVAQRILDRLSESFSLGGYEVYVTPSIGISVYPKDGDTTESMSRPASCQPHQHLPGVAP